MIELIQPNRITYFFGLIMALLLLASSIYFISSEAENLTDAIAEQRVLVHYDANTGVLVGGLIGCVALAMICLLPLIGKGLTSSVHTVLSMMFVIAVFVGIGGRLFGNGLVGYYLRDHHYSYCPEKSRTGLRLHEKAWVIDDSLCADFPFEMDNMTLPELKEMLKDLD